MKSKWSYVLPACIILAIFGIGAIVWVGYHSFFYWQVFAMIKKYVGLDTFRKVLTDSYAINSLKTTFIIVGAECLLELPLGFGIAWLLRRKFVGKGIVRAILVLPLTFAPIVVGTIWLLLLRKQIGPITGFLGSLGFNFDIGSHFSDAFVGILMMDTWHWTPLVALIFMAGLTNVPREFIESAQVSGANTFQLLKYVIIPYLAPLGLIALLLRLMDGFRAYADIWMLTGGGPGASTRVISIHLVRQIIHGTRYGYGSALSLVVLYIMVVVCWLFTNLVKREG